MTWYTIPKRTHCDPLQEFTEKGYPPLWRQDEKRNLSEGAAKMLATQGVALIPLTDEEAAKLRESRIPPRAKPEAKPVTAEQMAQAFEGQPRIKVVCKYGDWRHGWRDGNLLPHFEALGFPDEWLGGEVREIPVSLFALLSAGEFSRDPGDVAEAENSPVRGKVEARARQLKESWDARRAVKACMAAIHAKEVELNAVSGEVAALSRHPYANAQKLKPLDAQAQQLEAELRALVEESHVLAARANEKRLALG